MAVLKHSRPLEEEGQARSARKNDLPDRRLNLAGRAEALALVVEGTSLNTLDWDELLELVPELRPFRPDGYGELAASRAAEVARHLQALGSR